MEDIIKWLESHMFSCPYKKHIGIECLGCGMQRALIELLKGNIIESIILYPALIPTIALFLFLILHIRFKLKHGATILKILFIITVSIVVVNFVYKLIN